MSNLTNEENLALQLAAAVLLAAGRKEEVRVLHDLAWRLLNGKNIDWEKGRNV